MVLSGAKGHQPAEVAQGVYRLGTKWANFYLVQEGADYALIDAGYPRYFRQLRAAVAELGTTLHAIRGVVVTHHHVDHAGTAEALRSVAGVPVFANQHDADMVRGRRRSHVPPGFYRQSWRPSMMRYLAHTIAVGGARYRPVSAVAEVEDGQVLDLPGRPRVVHSPGHTQGHCSLVLDERGVLFAGDALVNFDYATGHSGIRQHRFNDDRLLALASLDRLAAVDANTVLFGHGDPWRGSPSRAVELARDRPRRA